MYVCMAGFKHCDIVKKYKGHYHQSDRWNFQEHLFSQNTFGGCFWNRNIVSLFCGKKKDYKNSHRRCSVRKLVPRNFTKFTWKHLCQSLFLIKFQPSTCNFIKKEIVALIFSCEFCEIFKNTFFTEHLWELLLKLEQVQMFQGQIINDLNN